MSARERAWALHEASLDAARFPPVSPDATVGGCASGRRADGPLEPADDAAEDAWLAVVVRDHHERPVADELVEVALDGGRLLQGRTDADGRIRFDGLRPDTGQAACPELLDDAGGEASEDAAD